MNYTSTANEISSVSNFTKTLLEFGDRNALHKLLDPIIGKKDNKNTMVNYL